MYIIEIERSAYKELSRVLSQTTPKIIEQIDALAHDPRPQGVKKLKGEESYRIRVGDYRVV